MVIVPRRVGIRTRGGRPGTRFGTAPVGITCCTFRVRGGAEVRTMVISIVKVTKHALVGKLALFETTKFFVGKRGY